MPNLKITNNEFPKPQAKISNQQLRVRKCSSKRKIKINSYDTNRTTNWKTLLTHRQRKTGRPAAAAAVAAVEAVGRTDAWRLLYQPCRNRCIYLINFRNLQEKMVQFIFHYFRGTLSVFTILGEIISKWKFYPQSSILIPLFSNSFL